MPEAGRPARKLHGCLCLVACVWLAAGCSFLEPARNGSTVRALPAAETIFRRDPRWLGADAALTIPLGGDRILWLFGDTFVATSARHVRAESRMVSNTVAIQTGTDPRTALMSFHWNTNVDGMPAAFFPDSDPGRRKYWPGHGVRLPGGPLLVFLNKIEETPGQGLGFANAGYAIAFISNPDAPVEMWNPRIVDMAPRAFDALPATAVLREHGYVMALAIRQQGTHAGALVRYPETQLAVGDASHAEWWAGPARGWVPEDALGPDGPEFVIDDAGAECSLHWDARTGSYVHIASYGFGASTIGLRTAPALTGPWGAPITVYRPSESDGVQPFVYAAKGHPELVAADSADLLVTYATNSFTFGDLLVPSGEQSLYWPRFVAVSLSNHRK